MKNFNGIPITVAGPGSQPLNDAGDNLDFVALPKEMNRYIAPELPEPEQVLDLQGAKAVTDWLGEALATYRVGGSPRIADISLLSHNDRDLVNQILGEGEVSLKYTDPAIDARMQESVLAGIWRTVYVDADGNMTRDLIEVCDVPVLARRAPAGDDVGNLARRTAPEDVMNAMPILTELHDRVTRWQPGNPAHVVNLTMLPLSDGDLRFLDDVLGTGPVATLSRGYGDCRITSTACPGIWRIRFTNSMGTPILETIEITDIPAVACAAQDDLDDTRRRFQELLEPYWRELS